MKDGIKAVSFNIIAVTCSNTADAQGEKIHKNHPQPS